jgi:NitT/TauT family transport system substrate-binding protein
MAVLALIATGCGGDETEPPSQSGDGGELITVRVGDILGTPSAFLQFGVEKGYFEEQGLDVQVEPNPGGAANIPGVVAGDFEIAGSNAVSVLLARGEGIPIKMISAGTFATNDQESDFSQILVTGDSDIEEPADLAGRSVAVNTLANIAEVTIRASLENAGAVHEDIDFLEMGFPDMVPALQEGRVDAVHVIEPFLSIGLDAGMRPIIAPYAGTRPGMAIGSYFSSDEYIAQNPEVIESFVAGVSAAGDYIAANPDEFREALVGLANVDPEVAAAVKLPPWGGPVDVGSVELIGELMVRFGLFEEVPPLDEVIYLP